MLFEHPFISQVHETIGFKLIMRGKETLILAIALMQRVLGDFDSEYPAVLVLIIANALSSILIFLISKRLFNGYIAFIVFLLYSFSVWPYMYILQAAHPPMVFLMFLLAVFFLQLAEKRKIINFLSGVSLGFMFFSSPTSTIYIPYYFGFWIYQKTTAKSMAAVKDIALQGGVIVLGMLIPFLYFTLPNPLEYLDKFRDFLNFSRKGNDFMIWRELLEKYFTFPETFRGGGLVWIIKYMFLILPVVFPVYLITLGYLIYRSMRKPSLFWVILLSVSTVILVELSQVAQFGRNYFSWFISILFLVGWAMYDYFFVQKKQNKVLFIVVISVVLLHAVQNIFIFTKDIFPSRMATTDIFSWLKKNNITQIYSYREHPLNKNILQFLVNPKLKDRLSLKPIDTIAQVTDGYILVQPLTGKSVLNACALDDYNRDPFLTMLYNSGDFKKYVVKEFSTLSSSRLWAEEEEVCAYRDLVLGQITPADRQKGKVWIMDAQKLQREFGSKFIKGLDKVN